MTFLIPREIDIVIVCIYYRLQDDNSITCKVLISQKILTIKYFLYNNTQF